ncbi:MAG: polysaccharide biosynthesis tyrosine autokinase [Nitrospiraceae bacterium]|nr:polysaccharide biosynthesis tyrosine autokinase [Nitrospiraceae bacterium]
MSKIEEAMEKAGRLREKAAPAAQAAAAEEKGLHSLHQKPAEDIEISSPRLVAANNYNLPISEEYRKLRSIVIQLTNQDRQRKTLMVTSSVGGEGKSVTALNLALSLAQEYDQRVLLIDTDLRNPSICRYLGLQRLPGVAECIEDDVDVKDVVVNTGLGSLLLLPAGREVTNPVEILSSEKMAGFLERLKQQFEGYFIIIDISPVLPFADARIIGSRADGVVFVVKEGGTSARNVRDALEALKTCNVMGVVFNKSTTAGLDGGYHYYYDYNYQGRDPEEQKTGLLSRLLRRRPRT